MIPFAPLSCPPSPPPPPSSTPSAQLSFSSSPLSRSSSSSLASLTESRARNDHRRALPTRLLHRSAPYRVLQAFCLSLARRTPRPKSVFKLFYLSSVRKGTQLYVKSNFILNCSRGLCSAPTLDLRAPQRCAINHPNNPYWTSRYCFIKR